MQIAHHCFCFALIFKCSGIIFISAEINHYPIWFSLNSLLGQEKGNLSRVMATFHWAKQRIRLCVYKGRPFAWGTREGT